MQLTPDLDEPLPQTNQNIWGKLISMNGAKTSSHDLQNNEITIGRLPTNTIVIPDSRLSGVHCKIKWDEKNNISQIQDLSTNGTFISDQKIGKNNEVLLKNGDEIFLLHKSKVPITDIIGFTLVIQTKSEIKKELDPAQQEKLKLMEDMQEDIHCPICDDVIYQCVSLMPCLHNFCGACFSDWMEKQKTCPTCRKDVDQVSKNPGMNNLAERYLHMHPEKKRPPEEQKEMDEKNKIKGDPLVFKVGQPAIQQAGLTTMPPVRGRGRGRGQQVQVEVPPQQPKRNNLRQQSNISDYSAEDDFGPVNRDCPTCKKEINGFQCNRKGQHIYCTNCQSKMPRFDAGETRLIYKCELCEKSFCTLYNKNCLQLSKKNPNQRFEKHQVPGAIDIQCFRQNYIEHKFFQDFMSKRNITTQDVWKYMLENYVNKGAFRYIVGKRTHTAPEKEISMIIKGDTPVCSQCFNLIWQQLIFRYRIAIRDQMESDAKNRGFCWFGINCKTMIHNQDHAKKLDHICEQTKF